MSDLHALLADFPSVDKYASLLAGLETHRIGLSELLTLDAAEVGKRTRLPLLDLQRLCEEVRAQLAQVPARPVKRTRPSRAPLETEEREGVGKDGHGHDKEQKHTDDPSTCDTGGRISTLDPTLDVALGGGFPTGVLSEVVGESGVGKTQLLLSLLVAVQLPPPRGLGRKALYISSEAPLTTSRLTQIIRSHPDHEALQKHCSLQAIATINTPDLEAQEHILMHQLPVQLSKAEQFGGVAGSFGLVVLDSVAANFRPFFGGSVGDRGGGGTRGPGVLTGRGSSLAARSLELTRLGMLLRTLAQKHNLAVVVANQVADRFDGDGGGMADGGIVTLSQQWNAGDEISGSIARHISSTIMSSAKRPRQGPMLPPPSVRQHQPPPSNNTPLTQESPLAARSRRQPTAAVAAAVAALGMSSQPEVDTKAEDLIKLPPSSTDEKPSIVSPEDTPLSANDFLPPSSQYIPPSQFPPLSPAPPVLQLDHQQRWFTGWGDDPNAYGGGGGSDARNKTPSLGLVWATQLGMRVALIKASRTGGHGGSGSGYRPTDGSGYGVDDDEYDESSSIDRHNTGAPRLRHSWRRWMKVVFAPHVAATGATSSSSSPTLERYKSALAARMQGAVEFNITMGGLRAVFPAADARQR
ncbi:hypothetical protein HMPREF1624_07268 [Sporothrix schenckii ATCC 58251]|uniref:RecA family profile 1 domain-containing protein n=1 Tax=Sporothrix schenckii (strain ATCC 58251 / de Perez 2211183) TaxID=1391915 RepID=U7PL29_SPOS1|nr:hypothetical protein HMPREF1624_07268 [Sporothrix schenckii ATCC 58251]